MKTAVKASNVNLLLTKQKTYTRHLRLEKAKDRKKKLKKLRSWILENRSKIQVAIYEDFKKSAEEVDISEIYPVLTEIRVAINNLTEWMSPMSFSPNMTYLGTSAQIYFEPKGTCLIISPWNYPFNLTVGPMVSAIAAGNTMMIKPSEYTPHTSELIEKMTEELFNEEEAKVFQGDYKISGELLELPFDHIFFTGSPRVGKIVMEAASKNLTSVTLELGGKSPTIVDETANLKDAAEKISWGKWLNAGQTCVAPDYLFVQENIRDKFLDELKRATDKIYAKKDQYTGIVNEAHFKRINEWIMDAMEKGAKLEYGGSKDDDNLKIDPIILSEVGNDATIMEEEIFGPILPVLSFSDLDEVIDYINQHPKPLALYHFSSRKSYIDQVKRETSAGTMCINDCVLQFSHPELPFGGVNNSGIGKAHGHHGFLAFSNEKSVLKQRTGLTMAKTLYPPFDSLKKRVINLMIKYF